MQAWTTRHPVLLISLTSSLFVFAGWCATADAQSAVQTDWSGGETSSSSTSEWGNTVAEADGIAWLAIPGQITLAGVAVAPGEGEIIDSDFNTPAGLHAADVDGDGLTDLLGAAVADNEIAWWRLSLDHPRTWTKTVIDASFGGAGSVHAADVDGDGDLDVVGAALDDHEIAWWENLDGAGAEWSRQTIRTNFFQAHWVEVADLDGDGRPDVMAAALQIHTVALWHNDGGDPIAWTEQIVAADFRGARHVEAADVDGDGDLDLVGAALGHNQVAWWRNDGGDPIAWVKHVLTDTLNLAHGVRVVDLDLDGDLDVIGAGYTAGWLSWWRNDGGDPLVWTEFDFPGIFSGGLVPEAGDLDGDNDLDVVATTDTFRRVSWWRNNGGDPLAWTPGTVVGGFAQAWPVVIADFDGNGGLEVAAGGSEVVRWRLADFISSGQLTSSPLEIPGGVRGLRLHLLATQPPGTSIEVELLISSEALGDGEWQLISPDLSLPVVVSEPCTVQYRLNLASSDASLSPIVEEVVLQWNDPDEAVVRSGGRGRMQP